MSGVRTDGAWLLREAMRTVLARAADGLAAEPFPSPEILLFDVGGRGRPYAALFASPGRERPPRLLVAPVNLLAGKILLRRVAGRRPLPGELAINYLVTARR